MSSLAPKRSRSILRLGALLHCNGSRSFSASFHGCGPPAIIAAALFLQLQLRRGLYGPFTPLLEAVSYGPFTPLVEAVSDRRRKLGYK